MYVHYNTKKVLKGKEFVEIAELYVIQHVFNIVTLVSLFGAMVIEFSVN